MVKQFTSFIGNKFVQQKSKAISLLNSFTGQEYAQSSIADRETVNLAVNSAHRAFLDYRKASMQTRKDILLQMANILEANREEISDLECEFGKTKGDGLVDVDDSVLALRYFGGQTPHGMTVEDGSYVGSTHRVPLGVIGAIVPFNYPINMAIWKIGPALICGNSIVLKPSEHTPNSLLYFIEKCSEFLPAGLVNVVVGDATTGDLLIRHPLIAKVSFTGSGKTASKIMESCAETLKPHSMELGGKSPIVVFGDCDIDYTVDQCFYGMFTNAGQNCCASSRLLVQENVYESFVRKIVEKCKTVKIGDPKDKNTVIGPLNNKQHYEKVCKYLENVDGDVLYGGRTSGPGFILKPTVIQTSDNSKIATEEIFGPILSILKPFKTLEEAINRCNMSEYGLAAGIFSKDVRNIETFKQNVDAGTIWINCYNMTRPYLPFGGMKKSGFGRDLGDEALNEFSQVKSFLQYRE